MFKTVKQPRNQEARAEDGGRCYRIHKGIEISKIETGVEWERDREPGMHILRGLEGAVPG